MSSICRSSFHGLRPGLHKATFLPIYIYSNSLSQGSNTPFFGMVTFLPSPIFLLHASKSPTWLYTVHLIVSTMCYSCSSFHEIESALVFPWRMMTLNTFGFICFSSAFSHIASSEVGTTTNVGWIFPGPNSALIYSSTCTVFPRPMSSARNFPPITTLKPLYPASLMLISEGKKVIIYNIFNIYNKLLKYIKLEFE